jgi:hypothetical protein
MCPETYSFNLSWTKLDCGRRVSIETTFSEQGSGCLLLYFLELSLGQKRGVEYVAHFREVKGEICRPGFPFRHCAGLDGPGELITCFKESVILG